MELSGKTAPQRCDCGPVDCQPRKEVPPRKFFRILLTAVVARVPSYESPHENKSRRSARPLDQRDFQSNSLWTENMHAATITPTNQLTENLSIVTEPMERGYASRRRRRPQQSLVSHLPAATNGCPEASRSTKALATKVRINMIRSAAIGCVTMLAAVLLGLVSVESACLFVVGSTSAHFIAGCEMSQLVTRLESADST